MRHGAQTSKHDETPPTNNRPNINMVGFVALAWTPAPRRSQKYPKATPIFRPYCAQIQVMRGYTVQAPSSDAALMKPNQAPFGEPMKSFHCSSDCRPFINDPSYPVAAENKTRKKMLRFNCKRCDFLYHAIPSFGSTAASSAPTACAFWAVKSLIACVGGG